MMRLRLAIAVLALSLSACTGQVGGTMNVPDLHMRGVTSGLRDMSTYGARAMPGYGARAIPADGETDANNNAPSNPVEQPVTFEGMSSVGLHSPTLP